MDESTQEAIERVMTEIDEARKEMKTVKDHLEEVLEQNDEYRNLKEDLKELTAKRASAKKLLQSDQDYQKVNAELEELKFKMKDLQEILSHHLVTYYNETQKTQIKDANGEVYQVVISAKIGKSGVVEEQ